MTKLTFFVYSGIKGHIGGTLLSSHMDLLRLVVTYVRRNFGGFDWLATKNDHKVAKIATFGHFWPFSTTFKAKKYLKCVSR